MDHTRMELGNLGSAENGFFPFFHGKDMSPSALRYPHFQLYQQIENPSPWDTLASKGNTHALPHSSSPADPCAPFKGMREKKRKRPDAEGAHDANEVVHLRAKRGHATDSHSLAERVRRGKINERLRCLQELVPGCYKTMGMAVMLDVVINYVQSLQNQIEFLSLKLSAASLHYDFNLEDDHIHKMQVPELQEMETYGGMAIPYFHYPT